MTKPQTGSKGYLEVPCQPGEGGARVGEAAWLERHACQAQTSQRPTLHPTAPRGCIVLLRTPLGLIITAKKPQRQRTEKLLQSHLGPVKVASTWYGM